MVEEECSHQEEDQGQTPEDKRVPLEVIFPSLLEALVTDLGFAMPPQQEQDTTCKQENGCEEHLW